VKTFIVSNHHHKKGGKTMNAEIQITRIPPQNTHEAESDEFYNETIEEKLDYLIELFCQVSPLTLY